MALRLHCALTLEFNPAPIKHYRGVCYVTKIEIYLFTLELRPYSFTIDGADQRIGIRSEDAARG